MTLDNIADKAEEIISINSFIYEHMKYIDAGIEPTRLLYLKPLQEATNLVKDMQNSWRNHEDETPEQVLNAGKIVNELLEDATQFLTILEIFKNYRDKPRFIADVNYYLEQVKDDKDAKTWIHQLNYLKNGVQNLTIFESILGK